MKSKILSILSIVLIAGSIFVNLSAQPQQAIRILYFNDAHELQPVETPSGFIGGVSRMKTLIDSIKKETPKAIVIFGGDLAGGTLGGKIFKGSVMVEALNTFPINYANFGQHEFDYGIDNTKKIIDESGFTWFSSNIILANGNPIPNTQPYIIYPVGDKKIGIIGITDKINTSKPTSGVKQTDIVTAAQTTIRQMGKPDYLIAVTQMDMTLNEALLVACPQINLILTEETSQYKTEIQFFKNTPIIAGCGNMGQLTDVIFNTQKNARITVYNVDNNIPENKFLKNYVQQKKLFAENQLTEVLSVLTDNASTNDFTGCLITDAFRKHYGVQAAIINGGGIRAKIPENIITVKDVYAVLPFENNVIPVHLTGREIKTVIDSAAQRLLPQVSGITYEITKGKKPKLKNVFINNCPINDNETYTVSLPDYIVLGGGNFNPIPQSQWIRPVSACDTDAQIVIDYLRNYPQLSLSSCNRIILIEEE